MSRGFTFRTTTGLIVGAYAVIAAVLVVGAGRDLGQVVGAYAPQVSWLMQGTTDARVEALLGAGRPETASLYAFVVAISWSMISALTAAGFAWGVLNKGATELGVDKAMNYLTALAGLYARDLHRDRPARAASQHPAGRAARHSRRLVRDDDPKRRDPGAHRRADRA
jgi:hypothetical protein